MYRTRVVTIFNIYLWLCSMFTVQGDFLTIETRILIKIFFWKHDFVQFNNPSSFINCVVH